VSCPRCTAQRTSTTTTWLQRRCRPAKFPGSLCSTLPHTGSRAVRQRVELPRDVSVPQDSVVSAYISELARFPDPGALRHKVGVVARGAQNEEELRAELGRSGERAEKRRAAEGMRAEWAAQAGVVASLLARHGVELPRDAASCIADGGVPGGKVFAGAGAGVGAACDAPGAVLRALQHAWNAHGPLLGAAPAPAGQRLLPVAMYVHRRPVYFAQALAALRAARGIGRVAALVVSLDAVDEAMLEVPFPLDLLKNEECSVHLLHSSVPLVYSVAGNHMRMTGRARD